MILCALTVGAVAGLVNGVLIAYGNLVPFIVTLAMLVSARGLAQRLAQNRTQIVTDQTIISIATTDVLGIPLLIWILAVVVALGWVLLNRTTFGRRTIAIGGNAEAARLAGIDVRRTTTLLYVISGLCAGLAGLLLLSMNGQGYVGIGDPYLLSSIAAVVLGGTSILGGQGSYLGTIAGAILLVTMTALITVVNASEGWRSVILGCLILAMLPLSGRDQSR